MIVSFHPVINAHRHILCAGRPPHADEVAAMRAAQAVILPQGCREELYQAARQSCPEVFPDYGARFRYPGKTGQIRLFREADLPHPPSMVFESLDDYRRETGNRSIPLPAYPFVFKFDWGGEGEEVYRVENRLQLAALLERAAACEASGQRGFLIQRLVDSGYRSLRVAIVGDHHVVYWRIQEDRQKFAANLRRGARLDHAVAPAVLRAAVSAARNLAAKTGINLAGLDYLFPTTAGGGPGGGPLLLEINYFFGRRGLGGSEAYYRQLRAAVHRWLGQRGLACPQVLDEVQDAPTPAADRHAPGED
jgi:ribosomal protein S6--L-glutamate ligase